MNVELYKNRGFVGIKVNGEITVKANTYIDINIISDKVFIGKKENGNLVALSDNGNVYKINGFNKNYEKIDIGSSLIIKKIKPKFSNEINDNGFVLQSNENHILIIKNGLYTIIDDILLLPHVTKIENNESIQVRHFVRSEYPYNKTAFVIEIEKEDESLKKSFLVNTNNAEEIPFSKKYEIISGDKIKKISAFYKHETFVVYNYKEDNSQNANVYILDKTKNDNNLMKDIFCVFTEKGLEISSSSSNYNNFIKHQCFKVHKPEKDFGQILIYNNKTDDVIQISQTAKIASVEVLNKEANGKSFIILKNIKNKYGLFSTEAIKSPYYYEKRNYLTPIKFDDISMCNSIGDTITFNGISTQEINNNEIKKGEVVVYNTKENNVLTTEYDPSIYKYDMVLNHNVVVLQKIEHKEKASDKIVLQNGVKVFEDLKTVLFSENFPDTLFVKDIYGKSYKICKFIDNEKMFVTGLVHGEIKEITDTGLIKYLDDSHIKTFHYGVVNMKGDVLLEPIYSEVNLSNFLSKKIITAKLNNEWIAFDTNGNKIINNVAKVYEDKITIEIDLSGKKKIPYEKLQMLNDAINDILTCETDSIVPGEKNTLQHYDHYEES